MAKDDERTLYERSFTRKGFVRGALAGGALAMSGGLLAACGGDDEEAASPPPSDTGGGTPQPTPTPPAGEPTQGGTIKFSVASTPRGFDPQKWWDDVSWDGSLNVFNRLTKIADDGTLQPELLEALPERANGDTLYTFKLRPGVMFHHGREMTADDVKFSFERLLAPGTAGEGSAQYQAIPFVGVQDILDEKSNELAGFTIVDDHTFTIELERPDSVFDFYLTLPFAAVVPRDVVEEAGDDFNFAPVGSGPFVMKDVDPNKGLVLERFADYWDTEGVAKVDRVEWEVGIDPELALLRIQDGELDLQGEPMAVSRLAEIQGNPELESQLFIADTNDLRYITLSLKHPAMKELPVRQAIAMAMDQEKLVRAVKGMGVVASGIWAPGLPFHSPDLGFEFDPEGAKQKLAEAGFADGFDVDIITLDYTPHKEIGQATQADLSAIGIRGNLKQFPLDAFLSAVAEFGPFIASDEFFSPFPHGAYRTDGLFTSAAIEAGCCNYPQFSDPAFDELAVSGHATSDAAAIAEIYKQVDRVVTNDEVLMVPLFYPKSPNFVSSRLRGFSVAVSPVPVARFFARYSIEE